MYYCFSINNKRARIRQDARSFRYPPVPGSAEEMSKEDYAERGILYYPSPREESFTIQVRERNPLLSKSERGILYYPSPREESFTIQVRERNPLLSKSERGILYYPSAGERGGDEQGGPRGILLSLLLLVVVVVVVVVIMLFVFVLSV